jgi:hypothetical protein
MTQIKFARGLFSREEEDSIETVTHPLLETPSPAPANELEAVVYSHAEHWRGVEEKPLRTFEEIVREIIRGGAVDTDDAVSVVTATHLISRLFDETKNALYGRWTESEAASDLRSYWNRPLGFDAVVEISAIDVGCNSLTSADADHADHRL